MEWLLIVGGIVLLLALIDKLRLFGNAPECREKNDLPISTREKTADLASAGGQVLRTATEATKGLYAALDELERLSRNWADEVHAKKAQSESTLGKSLSYRRMLLATLLNHAKKELEFKDKYGFGFRDDPNFNRFRNQIDERLGIEDDEKLRHQFSSLIRTQLREVDFFSTSRFPLPANLRLLSIPFLCHFTRIENLPSILEHGIVPVSQCAGLGINPIINDIARFDRRTHTSSFSIGHPNTQMLYKYRQLDTSGDWVVLAVNVATALSTDALFCFHNAADGRISHLPDDDLKMNRAFLRMFNRTLHDKDPARYNKPTDDQAEILIPRVVPSSDIHGIFFLSETGRTDHMSACGNRAVFDPKQSKSIFGRGNDETLGHTAEIIRGFDQQIDDLERAFKHDRRLFDALDKRITELTRFSFSGTAMGAGFRANEQRWCA